MNYEAAKFWLEVVLIVINLGLWLFVWNSNRNRVTNDKISELEARHNQELKEINKAIGDLDGRLKLAIGARELKPIYERINSMAEQLGEINGKMHTLDLIHDYMIKGDR